MRFGRLLCRFAAAALLLAMASGPRLLTAQTEIDDGGCKFKTRWKDVHGACPVCCDAIDYSCPCTT
jgi:hypothetical protein